MYVHRFEPSGCYWTCETYADPESVADAVATMPARPQVGEDPFAWSRATSLARYGTVNADGWCPSPAIGCSFGLGPEEDLFLGYFEDEDDPRLTAEQRAWFLWSCGRGSHPDEEA